MSIYVNIHVYMYALYKVDVMPKYQQTGRMIGLLLPNMGKKAFRWMSHSKSLCSFPSVTVTISTTLDLYSIWDWTLSHEVTAHIFYLCHQDGWTWLPTWLHCALTRSQVVLCTVQWGVFLGLFEVGTHPKAGPHLLVASHIKGHKNISLFACLSSLSSASPFTLFLRPCLAGVRICSSVFQ